MWVQASLRQVLHGTTNSKNLYTTPVCSAESRYARIEFITFIKIMWLNSLQISTKCG